MKFGAIAAQTNNQILVSFSTHESKHVEEEMTFFVPSGTHIANDIYRQAKIFIVSPQDFQDYWMAGKPDDSQGQRWTVSVEKRLRSIDNEAATLEDAQFRQSLLQAYPLEEADHLVKTSSKITCYEALQRGIAWSAMFAPETEELGLLFKIAEDGNSILSTAFGAIYIGLYGPDAALEYLEARHGLERYNSVQMNTECQAVYKALEDGLLHCRRPDGSAQDLGKKSYKGMNRFGNIVYDYSPLYMLFHPLVKPTGRHHYLEVAKERDVRLAS